MVHGLQHLRTPERIRSFELTYDAFAKLSLSFQAIDQKFVKTALEKAGIEITDEKLAAAQHIINHPEEYEVSTSKAFFLKTMLDLAPTIAESLLRFYRWNVITFDRPTLITGDNPVMILRDPEVPRIYGSGFQNAGAIWFPLSSQRLLLLDRERHRRPRVLSGWQDIAKKCNELIINSSYLEIYAHPELSAQFAGRSLGARPVIDISGGFDFLKQYRQPPLRLRPRR